MSDEYPKGWTRYPFSRLKNPAIAALIQDALSRQAQIGLFELHDGDIKVQIRKDGEIQVWRLEAYKR